MKLALLAVLVAGTLFQAAPRDTVLVKAADVKWGDHPFIKGGMLAVQSGDPSKGPSVVMMKFPKGLTIPAHTHTSDETVTVVAGCGVFGGGETIDVSKGTELGAGSYVVIPGKNPHWLVVKEDLIVTVNLNLPADIQLCGEKK